MTKEDLERGTTLSRKADHLLFSCAMVARNEPDGSLTYCLDTKAPEYRAMLEAQFELSQWLMANAAELVRLASKQLGHEQETNA